MTHFALKLVAASFAALPLVACADIGQGELLTSQGLEGGEAVPGDETPAQGDAEIGGEIDEGVGEDGDDDDACRCEFTTYNLDVRTGDTFVLSRFLSCGVDRGGAVFAYEEGDETFGLVEFNADLPVTITPEVAAGGEDGEGEYRLSLFALDGDEVDHITIRIDHDDVSDVGPNDATAPAPGPCGSAAAPL